MSVAVEPYTDASPLIGATVLLTEDDWVIGLAVQAMLQSAGCTVLGPAFSISDTMTLLAGSRPDAALLDLHLLDGRATEVAEALEATGVPFALMTGCGQKEIAEMHFSAIPILAKPFDEMSLRSTVRSLLQDRRAPR